MSKKNRLGGFDFSKLALVLIAIISSVSGAVIAFSQLVDSKAVSEAVAKFGSFEDVVKGILVAASVIAVLLIVSKALMKEVEDVVITYRKLRATIKEREKEIDKKLHVNE
jgi:hypothetical protein